MSSGSAAASSGTAPAAARGTGPAAARGTAPDFVTMNVGAKTLEKDHSKKLSNYLFDIAKHMKEKARALFWDRRR